MSVLNFGKFPIFISLLVWFHLASCVPTAHCKKSIPGQLLQLQHQSQKEPQGTNQSPINTGTQPCLNPKQSCLTEPRLDSWTTVTVDVEICVRQKCFWWKDQRAKERKKKFIMTARDLDGDSWHHSLWKGSPGSRTELGDMGSDPRCRPWLGLFPNQL